MKRTPCFSMAATILRDLSNPQKKEAVLENKDIIIKNFKRLALISSETEEALSFLFFKLGFDKASEFRKLSFVKDSDLYDVVDTYDLSGILKTVNGSWDLAWQAIENQLTKTEDQYGVAAKETISKFEKTFEQVKGAVMESYDVEFEEVIFSNFYWKGSTLWFQPF